MIRGLYETHLPVSDLKRSIDFYESLGLELALEYEDAAFLWIEKRSSWLGLWVTDDFETNRTPATSPIHGRHIAFRVDFEDIREAITWLNGLGIESAGFGSLDGSAPVVRPHQSNASVYFFDPDGNSLELMCSLPEGMPTVPRKLIHLHDFVR
jgi:catechol 2,3-dioxygenase-like lactoylglutathione lyase family enzyme